MENIGDNTAMKYVKTLRQVIGRAIDEGWIKHNTISGFKCTYIDPDRETPEQHELMDRYNKQISIKRLEEVRAKCSFDFSLVIFILLTRS
jgi:hypothetical protein